MTEPVDTPEAVPEAAPESPAKKAETAKRSKAKRALAYRSFWRSVRPHSPLGWIVEGLMVFVLAAGLGIVALRYGPLTTEARLFIEAQANGFEVGPFGKLKLHGVHGDVLRDFSIDALSISDAKGVWLNADHVAIRWRPAELLWRRLHIQSLAVGQMTVFRQPVLKQTPPGKGGQLAVQLDRIKLRLETAAAFSQTRAVYDIAGRFDQEVKGPLSARLDMRSVLRPGDFLTANLDIGRKDRLTLDAEAREVKGGGIAGSLGLAVDKPFLLSAHVTGPPTDRHLAAVTHSGADTPLRAQGGWSQTGGRMEAHLQLPLSRWTKDWANALGPEAALTLSAKQKAKTLYDVEARLQMANLTLVAHGPADSRKNTSKGLATTLTVNSLAKIVPQPVMGRGQISGVLSGSLSDMKLTGTVQASDFEFVGYRLTRAAGPVSLGWRKNQFFLQATANGYGASGSGPMAAAGGPTPVGRIDLNSLPDGRVLIKSMSILGKGVKINGAGGQNLFGGGLTFKGQMLIPDMTLVAQGGTGSFEAGWSADQTNAPGAPWTFNLEAHGDKFATGQAGLDGLMGAQPKLTGHAGFIGDTVTFDRIALNGAKVDATAQGDWKLDGSIKFGLGWQADGPFLLGPLEVDGKAKGGGTLTGTIDMPRLDLLSDLESVNFPNLPIKAAKLGLSFVRTAEGADGHVSLTGQTEYGAAQAKSDFRMLQTGLQLSSLDVDAGGVRAQGGMSLMDQGVSTADLTMSIKPGAMLSEGRASGHLRIVGAQGAANVDMDLSAKGAVLRGQGLALGSAHLTAKGPINHLPYQVSADGAVAHAPFKLDGSGFFIQDPHGYSIAFDGSGQLRRSQFRTLETAQVRLDDNDHFARLRLSLGGGRAEFDGRETAAGADIKAVLKGVDLSFVSEDFTGQFDADLDLSGRGKDLHGALQAALKNAHSRDAKPGLSIDGQVKAQLDDGRLTIDSMLKSAQGLTSSANFVLPVDAAATPFHLALARERPMQGHFEANGEVQPLWDLFLGGERSLGGALTAKADFAGTLADPKITGRADLTGGRFEDFPTGLKLRDATVGASLNTDTISVDKFSAGDGQKGQITGEGQISLARGGASNLLFKLNNFRLVDNDTASANATGQLTAVRGADGKVRIAGALEVVNGEINAAAKTSPDIPTLEVIEKNRPFSLAEQLQAPPALTTQNGVVLDVTLTARRGLLVKGRGLDVDMSLDAKVTGPSAKPVLSGEARVVRGDYDFGGQRFTFDNRGTVQLSNDPHLIRLNLTATREDPTLTAVINIQGTAAKPQISLSSTPVLPNDEVLSQVLFGSSAAQLSPLQAAQLASALTALASGGGFDVIGGLRSFARLDRLALVGGGTTGVSVAGGKYIGDKLYVQLAGGGREGPSAEVEYRITRNLSLASRLANILPAAATTNTTPGTVVQSGSSLSIRWRQDFRDKPPK